MVLTYSAAISSASPSWRISSQFALGLLEGGHDFLLHAGCGFFEFLRELDVTYYSMPVPAGMRRPESRGQTGTGTFAISRCNAKDFILGPLSSSPGRPTDPRTGQQPGRSGNSRFFFHCPLTESTESSIIHANDPSRQRLLA